MTKTLLAGIIAAALLIPSTGCKIITREDGTTARVIDADRVADIAGRATAIGTWIYLRKHPETRPAFETAVQSLNALIGGENYDPVALAKALEKLPIKELSGPDGVLYITLVLEVFDVVAKTAAPITQKEVVAKTLVAIRDGLVRGLSATSAGLSDREAAYVNHIALDAPSPPNTRPILRTAELMR